MTPTPPAAMSQYEAMACAEDGKHVSTFSNGHSFDVWASRNCYRCVHEETCVFTLRAMLDLVSPELARAFGWDEDTTEPEEHERFSAPKQCAVFTERAHA